MGINRATIRRLARQLGEEDAARIEAQARETQKIENHYNARVDADFERSLDVVVAAAMRGDELPVDLLDELDETFRRHFVDTYQRGHDSALTDHPLVPARVRAAARKKIKAPVRKKKTKGAMPDDPLELRYLYDAARRGTLPPELRRQAASIKREYLKRLRELYDRLGRRFRDGERFDQADVRRYFEQAMAMPRARANTTVNTETTRYYNGARHEVYDAMPQVTHYLASAVRDAATTKWCRPGVGRDGLVYPKNHPELRRGPPWHWNCRTETLPLTPANPRHRKLIEDASIARDNRRPTPLPKGWVGSR